ncbi:MAG: hypothetical protein HGA93_06935, partial [Methanothrix sp.]|nr:hypothetical protein [Methanothrix sp.]
MTNKEQDPKQANPSGGYLNTSLKLNILFASEAGISFLFDVVIAASIGLGLWSDAFYAAFVIPQFIGRGIFQSMTNSFLGIFSANADRDSRILSYNQAISVIAITSL